MAAPFNIFLPAMFEGSDFSTSLPPFVTVFLIIGILVGVKLYLIVDLICISPMTNGARFVILVNSPRKAYWPFVYLL